MQKLVVLYQFILQMELNINKTNRSNILVSDIVLHKHAFYQ